VEQTRKLIEQEGVLLIFSTFGTVTNVAGGIFNRAMTEMSRGGAEAIIQAYDFSAFQHVVDVGGARPDAGGYPRRAFQNARHAL
jgi:hypothetical protein